MANKTEQQNLTLGLLGMPEGHNCGPFVLWLFLSTLVLMILSPLNIDWDNSIIQKLQEILKGINETYFLWLGMDLNGSFQPLSYRSTMYRNILGFIFIVSLTVFQFFLAMLASVYYKYKGTGNSRHDCKPTVLRYFIVIYDLDKILAVKIDTLIENILIFILFVVFIIFASSNTAVLLFSGWAVLLLGYVFFLVVSFMTPFVLFLCFSRIKILVKDLALSWNYDVFLALIFLIWLYYKSYKFFIWWFDLFEFSVMKMV